MDHRKFQGKMTILFPKKWISANPNFWMPQNYLVIVSEKINKISSTIGHTYIWFTLEDLVQYLLASKSLMFLQGKCLNKNLNWVLVLSLLKGHIYGRRGGYPPWDTTPLPNARSTCDWPWGGRIFLGRISTLGSVLCAEQIGILKTCAFYDFMQSYALRFV